jgi:hypothetical protein
MKAASEGADTSLLSKLAVQTSRRISTGSKTTKGFERIRVFFKRANL